MKYASCLLLCIVLGTCCYSQKVSVYYSPLNVQKYFTGQVILYLSKNNSEPRQTTEDLCYRLSVKNIKSGQKIVFDNQSIFYPVPFTKLERGKYYLQAVWDRDMGGRNIGTSPGNVYNKTVQIEFTIDTNKMYTINCKEIIPEEKFTNSVFIKELKVPSRLLERFSKKPQSVDAAVILPKQYYTERQRWFPVLFIIGGYGADYHHYSKENGDTLPSTPIDTIDCIRIYLDGNCRLGHNVYANSDNNGPWADALVTEFIPALKKLYRCNNSFLMKGHSSGGWAVLWLQIHYPKIFAGCNASAPDYVDFHSLNQRDYYKEIDDLRQSKYVKPIVTHPHIEDVLYRGEQDRSFDAVYGPKGVDGNPISIQNLNTGVIRPDIFEYWKRYDITSYLTRNFEQERNDLYGKVRLSVGNEDTYHLNLAVQKMEEAVKPLNTGFTYAYYPGDHYSVMTPQYKKDEANFLAAKYLEWVKLNNETTNR